MSLSLKEKLKLSVIKKEKKQFFKISQINYGLIITATR